MRHRRRSSGKKGHGALWSIIYIDLMTQIMAFFVILWSVEHGTKLTQTPSLGTGVGMGDQTARMVDLPGDVLFASGQTQMAPDGKAILDKLFGDAESGVLSFDQGGPGAAQAGDPRPHRRRRRQGRELPARLPARLRGLPGDPQALQGGARPRDPVHARR